MNLLIHPQTTPLRGTARVPGDKSISHRTLLFGALAEGETVAAGWLPAEDCLATMRVLQMLGVDIRQLGGDAIGVRGVGLYGLQEPEDVLDCGGSGTTMRLLMGILAGQSFLSVLTGNPALRRRPMGRVAAPLQQMGATILGRTVERPTLVGRRSQAAKGERAPLAIRGGKLRAMRYEMPMASAQVKSALLLAGLYADGETTVIEPGPTRDHTERLLTEMGVSIERRGNEVTIIPPTQKLTPLSVGAGGYYQIPADPSSAAFPLAAALLVRDSRIILKGVGVNPTRTGLLDIVSAMGSDSLVTDSLDVGIEPIADIHVSHAELEGTTIGGETVVRAIDEFPILTILATQAQGVTTVRDAGELRVKESDRIASIAQELALMGVMLEETNDGFTVRGPVQLRGANVDSHMDHRLAMALAIAGLVADGPTTIARAEVINDSFPGFVELMNSLGCRMQWIPTLSH